MTFANGDKLIFLQQKINKKKVEAELNHKLREAFPPNFVPNGQSDLNFEIYT